MSLLDERLCKATISEMFSETFGSWSGRVQPIARSSSRLTTVMADENSSRVTIQFLRAREDLVVGVRDVQDERHLQP
ncbi:MAG: hypothetical protein U0169_00865 [Polyangiaceae bacterium]